MGLLTNQLNKNQVVYYRSVKKKVKIWIHSSVLELLEVARVPGYQDGVRFKSKKEKDSVYK